MEDKIFLLVRVTIETEHLDIHEAIEELQTKTVLQLTSTSKVKVAKAEIIPLKTKKS
jgi:hypothetical protein